MNVRKGLNPLTDVPASDVEDMDCVRRSQSGSREALEQLIARHQAWIYNIVVRMLYYPHDAEDATQEILIKVITRTLINRAEFTSFPELE